ncbi:hypothetical protein BTS2_0252 [Bacillus sp. TS-2]|nr:hypothetical protein BTS2_0252 [Bacillus sp. TS-2]
MNSLPVFQRYLIFILGLFFMGLGIALVTKSSLGTTAISSVPYVWSYAVPISFGTLILIVCVIFLLLQVLIVGKEFPKVQYLQLLVGPIFGFFIDFGMFLFSFITIDIYVFQLGAVIFGSFILALGIYLQVGADVIMNPGEGIVKVLAMKWNIQFGNMKIMFDWSLVVIAVLSSLMLLGEVVGIREGTVLSAFLVGYFIKKLRYYFDERHLMKSIAKVDKEAV